MSSQLMNEFLSVPDDIDSDAESIDSEQENALKYVPYSIYLFFNWFNWLIAIDVNTSGIFEKSSHCLI